MTNGTKAERVEARLTRAKRLKQEHARDQAAYQWAVYAGRLLPSDLDNVGSETIDGCRRALAAADAMLDRIEARMMEREQ